MTRITCDKCGKTIRSEFEIFHLRKCDKDNMIISENAVPDLCLSCVDSLMVESRRVDPQEA